MKFRLKLSLLLILLIGLNSHLTASEDIAVTARDPWKKKRIDSHEEYVLNTSKGFPPIQISTEIKPGTFYRLSWEMRNVVDLLERQMQFRVELEGAEAYTYGYVVSKEWNPYSAYFYSMESTRCKLSIYPNPINAETEIHIKGITLVEVPQDQIRKNVIPEGDFENNTELPTFWQPGSGCEGKLTATIVPSKDFISGEKCMEVDLTNEGSVPLEIRSNFMPVEPGHSVKLKFWAKADDEKTIAVIIQGFGPIHSGGHFYKGEKYRLDKEWREYSLSAVIPSDLGKYPDLLRKIVFISINGDRSRSGKVYFDNMELYTEP